MSGHGIEKAADIRVKHPVHSFPGNADVKSVQRIVLTASRFEPIGKTDEVPYDNLLNAVNAKLKRPLKDGFRMEGHLASAKLEKVYLPGDGIEIALPASGELKILYGM